jgi:hypothetical protein
MLLHSRVWQAKDAAAAKELAARVTQLATGEGALTRLAVAGLTCRLTTRLRPGHTAATEVAADNSVTVELWTSALGGLTENDFIVAAKLDAMPLSDLVVVAKKRTYFF